MITRRALLRAIALGGGMVAGDLWIPGATRIFLPPKFVVNGATMMFDELQMELGENSLLDLLFTNQPLDVSMEPFYMSLHTGAAELPFLQDDGRVGA